MARLLCSALLLLLLIPQPAAAAPLRLAPRLVVGDTRHYINAIQLSMTTSKSQSVRVDMNMAIQLQVEELLDDGSARIRETVESADTGDTGLPGFDVSRYVGQSEVYLLHPDGSTSTEADAQDGLSSIGGSAATAALFPPTGLDVGQSFDATTTFPTVLPGFSIPPVPVHTTLDGVVDSDGQPAARMVQTMKIKDAEVPFGPFGASGSAKFDGDSYEVSQLALDTGWPIREDGVVAYNVDVTSEKQQQTVAVRLELHMAMDDEALADS